MTLPSELWEFAKSCDHLNARLREEVANDSADVRSYLSVLARKVEGLAAKGERE